MSTRDLQLSAFPDVAPSKPVGLVQDDALFAEVTASKSEVTSWIGAEITVSGDLDWWPARGGATS